MAAAPLQVGPRDDAAAGRQGALDDAQGLADRVPRGPGVVVIGNDRLADSEEEDSGSDADAL